MDLEQFIPEKSFVSTSHFIGIVMEYDNDDVIFYQTDDGNQGFMTISKGGLIDDLEATEYVEIDRRACH